LISEIRPKIKNINEQLKRKNKMGKFIKGQKVICVDVINTTELKENRAYKVIESNEMWTNLEEFGSFFTYRFKTIIESIDDVLPGMELTIVNAVDENNIEKIKEYGFESYLGWTDFLGNKVIVEKVSRDHFTDKSIIHLKNTGLVWPIELIKEYPGNVGTDNLKKEKKEMEYKITQRYGNGITLSDIYDKKPKSCSEWDAEFSTLLDTQRLYLDEKFINSIDCYKVWKKWLLKEGFIEKVKPEFEPFNLTFRIENEDMLKEMWHKLNMANPAVVKHVQTDDLDLPTDWNNSVKIWQVVEDACKRLGLRKDK
jgi:hypothetical protein